MNNNKPDAAGFAWRRADRTAAAGEWLLDVAIALAVAVVALFFGMMADAHARERGEGPRGAITLSSAAGGADPVAAPCRLD